MCDCIERKVHRLEIQDFDAQFSLIDLHFLQFKFKRDVPRESTLYSEHWQYACQLIFLHHFLQLPDDAVERRKLGVNKERTTVALKGFI